MTNFSNRIYNSAKNISIYLKKILSEETGKIIRIVLTHFQPIISIIQTLFIQPTLTCSESLLETPETDLLTLQANLGISRFLLKSPRLPDFLAIS